MQIFSDNTVDRNRSVDLNDFLDSKIVESGEIRFVTSTNPSDYEQVRKRIAQGMSSRFQGWDSEYDRQFDPYSQYFFLLNQQNDLLASSRLVCPEDHSQPLPIQVADQLEQQYDHHIGEYSGFWFRSRSYGLLLAAIGGIWLHRNTSGLDIFAVYESRSKAMEKLYLDLMEMSPVLPKQEICYPSFRYRKSNAPVTWTLVVEEACARLDRARNILAKVHPQVLQQAK